MEERCLIGWKAIADMFQVSERTMIKKKKDLLECGVIFYMHHGRPPRRQVCAFPSLLFRWTILKSSKGRVI
jgi:predicted DNA-binding transcriptional regulator YafY